MTEGWKIFIAGTAITLLILVFIMIWPYIKDKIWGKHPDTYIYLIGQEHSYTINQLRTVAPVRSKIRFVPLKFPEGVSSVSNNEIPLKFSDWTYPKNTKLYTIAAHNKGDGIDRNIKIDIDFTPNSIKSVKMNHKERVSLL